MNLTHFGTIVWLRWRLAINQINRLTPISRLIMWLLLFGSFAAGFSSFLFLASAGGSLLPTKWSEVQPRIWDGLICGFLMLHLGGIFTGLQKSETLSLEKILPLPVSPWKAFLLNFFSLAATPGVIATLPSMLGMCVAMMVRYGLWMSASLPLVLCFLLLATAATFQFRTWLLAIMQNRRQRFFLTVTVIAVLLAISVGPAISVARTAGKFYALSREPGVDARAVEEEFLRELITEELPQNFGPVLKYYRYLPPFWLSAGIAGLGSGKLWVAAAAGFGMLGLAGLSLQRSYWTTLQLCRQSFSAGAPAGTLVESAQTIKSRQRVNIANWLDLTPRWLNPRPAAVAMVTLRNESRVPGVVAGYFFSLMLLIALGSCLYWFRESLPKAQWAQELVGLGVCWLTIAMFTDTLQNQFSHDRSGFRSLLLAPLQESQILFGKNAAALLRSALLGLVAVMTLAISLSLSWSHCLAFLFQIGALFLIACLTGNLVSILCPLATKADFAGVELLFVRFLLGRLSLLAYLPFLALVWLEWFAGQVGWFTGVPISLLGSLAYFLVLAVIYPPLVYWQAGLLRRRKWRILETVTSLGN